MAETIAGAWQETDGERWKVGRVEVSISICLFFNLLPYYLINTGPSRAAHLYPHPCRSAARFSLIRCLLRKRAGIFTSSPPWSGSVLYTTGRSRAPYIFDAETSCVREKGHNVSQPQSESTRPSTPKSTVMSNVAWRRDGTATRRETLTMARK